MAQEMVESDGRQRHVSELPHVVLGARVRGGPHDTMQKMWGNLYALDGDGTIVFHGGTNFGANEYPRSRAKLAEDNRWF
jgi:hypothetical protein